MLNLSAFIVLSSKALAHFPHDILATDPGLNLFDENGSLVSELKAIAPEGPRRMSANPNANGGLLHRALNLPDFRQYAIEMTEHGHTEYGKKEFENTKVLG